MMPFWKPDKVIADRGPASIGRAWADIADIFDFQYILISREAAFENGTVEREAWV